MRQCHWQSPQAVPEQEAWTHTVLYFDLATGEHAKMLHHAQPTQVDWETFARPISPYPPSQTPEQLLAQLYAELWRPQSRKMMPPHANSFPTGIELGKRRVSRKHRNI